MRRGATMFRLILMFVLVSLVCTTAAASMRTRVATTDADPDGNACSLKSPPVIVVYDNSSVLEFFACTSSTWSEVASSTVELASGCTGLSLSAPDGGQFDYIYVGNEQGSGTQQTYIDNVIIVDDPTVSTYQWRNETSAPVGSCDG